MKVFFRNIRIEESQIDVDSTDRLNQGPWKFVTIQVKDQENIVLLK